MAESDSNQGALKVKIFSLPMVFLLTLINFMPVWFILKQGARIAPYDVYATRVKELTISVVRHVIEKTLMK